MLKTNESFRMTRQSFAIDLKYIFYLRYVALSFILHFDALCVYQQSYKNIPATWSPIVIQKGLEINRSERRAQNNSTSSKMRRNKSKLGKEDDDSASTKKSALKTSNYTTVQLTATFEEIKNLPRLWFGTQVVMEWADDYQCIKSELKRHLNATKFPPIVMEWKLRCGKHGKLQFDHGASIQGSFKIRVKKFSDPSFQLIGVHEMDPEVVLRFYFDQKKWESRENVNFGNRITGTLCTCVEVIGTNYIEQDRKAQNEKDRKMAIDEAEQDPPRSLRFKDPTAGDFQPVPHRFHGCRNGVNGQMRGAQSFQHGCSSGTPGPRRKKRNVRLERTLSEITHDNATIFQNEESVSDGNEGVRNSRSKEDQFGDDRPSLYKKALDDEIKKKISEIETMRKQLGRSFEASDDMKGACELNRSSDLMKKDDWNQRSMDNTPASYSQNKMTESSKNLQLGDSISMQLKHQKPEFCRAKVLKTAERDIANATVALVRKVLNKEIMSAEEVRLHLPNDLNHDERAYLRKRTEELEMSILKVFKALLTSNGGY